jgi:trk system potassium uptake protein TrkA
MKKFAVIGLGRFGRSVASTLFGMGVEVMAFDRDREIVDAVQDEVTHAIALDATNKNLLLDQGVDQVDCAVVGIGENFESNVLVTRLLREFGIPIVITRAYNDIQKEILKSIGATQVLSPEEDIGKRLAKSLVTGEIVDFLELPEGFAVKLIPAPRKIFGKTLADAKIRNEYMLDVIVIRRKVVDEKTKDVSTKFIVIPDGNEVVEEGDVLGVIGKETDIERFT